VSRTGTWTLATTWGFMDEKTLYELVCVNNRCPECNGVTRQIEKETFSGQEMREYECQACGWRHIFELGPALWTVFSNANNDDAPCIPAPSRGAERLPPKAGSPPARPTKNKLRWSVLIVLALLAAVLLGLTVFL
jgi:hypothetical protein